MIALLFAMFMTASQAACEPPPLNHPSAPVGARAPALGRVVLEIPLLGAVPEPKEILEVLSKRDLPATLMVSADWAERHDEFLRVAAKQGHEVGLWVSLQEDIGLSGAYVEDPAFSDWVDAIRTARTRVKRASGVKTKTIGMATLTPIGEFATDALAFKAVLPNERTVGDRPRRVSRLDQAKGRARVIGQGRYTDGCGHILPHWTPAGLDRATHAAARAEWVRVGLPSSDGVSEMLSRWLDDVVLAEQWSIVTASEMAKAAAKAEDEPSKPPPAVAVAKRVTPDLLMATSKVLSSTSTLPRRAAADLNLTEAYFALVTMVATGQSDAPVTLGHLDGPANCARTELKEPVTLTAEDVQSVAEQLHDRLSGQVPSLITVGGHGLTAAETLQLLARAHQGASLSIQPVNNPQPFAPDCGWGASTGL